MPRNPQPDDPSGESFSDSHRVQFPAPTEPPQEHVGISHAPVALSPENPLGPMPLPDDLGDRLAQQGHEFLAGVLQEELTRRADNRGALTTLSQSLGMLGRHLEGRRVNERLVSMLPKHPVAHYNLACSQALTGEESSALRSLERAIEFGFHDADFLDRDPDLRSLRDSQPFQRLVQFLKECTHRP